MTPDFEEKNIYLKKDNDIIGLHEIGFTDSDGNWLSYETWGNEYDDRYNMLGRGSFRIFNDIETVAKEFEADGFVRFEGPNVGVSHD